MIVGFAGHSKAGKDTAASYLIEHHGYVKRAFADNLKQLCSRYFKLPLEAFENQELKDKLLETPVSIDQDNILELLLEASHTINYINFNKITLPTSSSYIATTPRDILKYVGTDVFRNYVDELYWTKAAIKDLKYSDKVVFTDVRFRDERLALNNLTSKLVLLKRNNNIISTHRSENSLGFDAEYDVVIENNDSKEDLYRNLELWYKGITLPKRIYG